MEHEKIVTLDLTDCTELGELHKRIKQAFHFPDYYGENWDAFYDLLCTDSTAEQIMIRGVDKMSNNLADQVERMYKTIDRAKKHLEKFHITLYCVII